MQIYFVLGIFKWVLKSSFNKYPTDLSLPAVLGSRKSIVIKKYKQAIYKPIIDTYTSSSNTDKLPYRLGGAVTLKFTYLYK